MIGVIVISHGSFSEQIIKSCEIISGPAQKVTALTLNRNDNIEDLNKKFVKSLKTLDDGDGVLVLVDLLGGSPSNIASLNLKNGGRYQIVTGVNVPMLLEALLNRENFSLEKLAENCIEAGHSGIVNVNAVLR